MAMGETDGKKGMLQDRLFRFAVRIIKLANALPKSHVGIHVGKQILRSGTSPGANYEEAIGAESRKDFVHKLQIALKELRETHYWLRIIQAAELLAKRRMTSILQESDELIAMTVASIKTAKGRKSDDS